MIKPRQLINRYNLFIILMLCALTAHAGVAGKVIYGHGDYFAYDADGNKRKLAKGKPVMEGDTLVVNEGRMQVRFNDGGLVSVYPNSEYKIEAFNYIEEDEVEGREEEKSWFSLLKGAARQVTGLIGRNNNENFRFKTTVATIGIRGTGFFVQLCQGDCFDADGNPLEDGLYIKNGSGFITVKTNAGELVLAPGQSAFTRSMEDMPVQISQPPLAYNIVSPDMNLFDIEGLVPDDFGDVTDPGLIDPPVDPTPAFTALLTHAEAVYIPTADALGQLGADTNLDVNDSINHTNEIVDNFTDADLNSSFDRTGGTLEQSGFNNTLGVVWQRWTSIPSILENGGTETPGGNGDVHVIASADLTSTMPTNVTLDYSNTNAGAGGTSPTITTASAVNVVGTQTVTMNATFNMGNVDINSLNVQLDFGGATINIELDSPPQRVFGNNGSVVMSSSFCDPSLCGVNGFVSGNTSVHFIGNNAEGAYGAYNFSGGADVLGTYLITR